MIIVPPQVFLVSYSDGFLHHNVRGTWYPACVSEMDWAIKVCTAEVGLVSRYCIPN